MINDSWYLLYYAETNIICVLILLVMLIALGKEGIRGYRGAFLLLIIEVIAYCGLDICAAYAKGASFYGVRYMLYISNTLYITMPIFICLTWKKYVRQRLHVFGRKMTKVEKIFTVIMLAIGIASLSTPLTGFSFYLDENNMYHRHIGAYLVPVMSYVLMLAISLYVVQKGRKSRNFSDRRTSAVLALFIIPPIVASIIQISVYGVTTAQVGMTLALLIVFALDQRNQIFRDELTGLNNKREYERYLFDLTGKSKSMYFCMIDVDNFKLINDSYGHPEGDQAIRDAAGILQRAIQKTGKDFFLARFGGDEFVVLRNRYEDGDEQLFEQSFAIAQQEYRDSTETKYELSFSIGMAFGVLDENNKPETYIEMADDNMYACKKQHHTIRK